MTASSRDWRLQAEILVLRHKLNALQTKTSELDKRTGCLQSNVNFLQRLVTKNALEAWQKLNAADAEIVALKSAVTSLQKTVEQLQKPATK